MKLENARPEPQLEFTVATEKEFDEILAMSKGIYGGLDYLPSRYHSWIREPNRTVVLAKKNGAVVRNRGSRAPMLPGEGRLLGLQEAGEGATLDTAVERHRREAGAQGFQGTR